MEIRSGGVTDHIATLHAVVGGVDPANGLLRGRASRSIRVTKCVGRGKMGR
jgi:hypothetical protein